MRSAPFQNSTIASRPATMARAGGSNTAPVVKDALSASKLLARSDSVKSLVQLVEPGSIVIGRHGLAPIGARILECAACIKGGER